jgi:hypothetical protein
VRNQANQEQNNKYEEANSGNLGRSKGYTPKTEHTG